MNDTLDKIVEQLRAQEAEIQSQVQRLKQQLAIVSKQFAQVQSAIHSLSGRSAGAALSPVGPAAKPTLSVAEIREIVLDAKQRNQSVTGEQLFVLVEKELMARGGKKHGLRAKFQKVLSELAEQSELQLTGIKAPSM